MEEFFVQEVKVGHKVEDFSAEAYDPSKDKFIKVSLKDNMKKGKWTILFFWPKDFTFVCPTEIVGLSDRIKDFDKLNANVYGVSTDTAFVHQAWSKLEVKNGGIGKVNYPLLEDANHALSSQFGVLLEDEGVALRGLFIISPEGILEHSTINNLNVGRNVDEIIRTLEALNNGGLCPLNWTKGDKTL
ncbi:MAG: peroxiredoxin [Mycoplasmatales bacterium]